MNKGKSYDNFQNNTIYLHPQPKPISYAIYGGFTVHPSSCIEYLSYSMHGNFQCSTKYDIVFYGLSVNATEREIMIFWLIDD